MKMSISCVRCTNWLLIVWLVLIPSRHCRWYSKTKKKTFCSLLSTQFYVSKPELYINSMSPHHDKKKPCVPLLSRYLFTIWLNFSPILLPSSTLCHHHCVWKTTLHTTYAQWIAFNLIKTCIPSWEILSMAVNWNRLKVIKCAFFIENVYGNQLTSVISVVCWSRIFLHCEALYAAIRLRWLQINSVA